MSQQEFMPESQRERSTRQDNEEIYTEQSYSQYRASSDMPKRDHPADFDGAIPPYSYQAQDRSERQQGEAAAYTPHQQARQRNERSRQAPPRGSDTFQQGYRFYQRQWQRFYAPWQRQPTASKPNWGILLLLSLGLLCALPILIKLLLLLFAAMIVLGFVSLLLILGGLIIYHFYFKKRWRNFTSRWRWW